MTFDEGSFVLSIFDQPQSITKARIAPNGVGGYTLTIDVYLREGMKDEIARKWSEGDSVAGAMGTTHGEVRQAREALRKTERELLIARRTIEEMERSIALRALAETALEEEE